MFVHHVHKVPMETTSGLLRTVACCHVAAVIKLGSSTTTGNAPNNGDISKSQYIYLSEKNT